MKVIINPSSPEVSITSRRKQYEAQHKVGPKLYQKKKVGLKCGMKSLYPVKSKLSKTSFKVK